MHACTTVHFCSPTSLTVGRWKSLDVAVKIMMFQNTPPPGAPPVVTRAAGHHFKVCDRQLAVREAALCCSMSHPNVVATYHYEVLQASAFCQAPSGLRITDKSNEGDFKLFLIQARTMSHGGGTHYESWRRHPL